MTRPISRTTKTRKNRPQIRWTAREWRKVLKEYPAYALRHPKKTVYEVIIAVNKLVLPKERQRKIVTTIPGMAALILGKQTEAFVKKINSSSQATQPKQKVGRPRKIKQEVLSATEEKGFEAIHQQIDDEADAEAGQLAAISESVGQNTPNKNIYEFDRERYRHQLKPAVVVTDSQWADLFLYATDPINQKSSLRKFLEKYLAYHSPSTPPAKVETSIATMPFDDLFLQITERNDAVALLVELEKYFSDFTTEAAAQNIRPKSGTSAYTSYLVEKMFAGDRKINELSTSLKRARALVHR